MALPYGGPDPAAPARAGAPGRTGQRLKLGPRRGPIGSQADPGIGTDGGAVDEFNIPALAEIPATANLAQAVFRRAAEQPQAVMLRRPGAAGLSGDWLDVTTSQFKDEVTALAKGLIAAGIQTGDR